MPNNIIMQNVPNIGWTTKGIADCTEPFGDIVIAEKNVSSYAFANKTLITGVTLLNATSVGEFAFYNCRIVSLIADKLEAIATSGFDGFRTAMLVLPSTKITIGRNAFGNNSLLTAADFGGVSSFAYSPFVNCSNLGIIVVRGANVAKPHEAMFIGTKFYRGKAGGTLYVPADLIASYQANAIWATLLGNNENNQIKSIESTHADPDAPIDLTLYYVDGTPLPASS